MSSAKKGAPSGRRVRVLAFIGVCGLVLLVGGFIAFLNRWDSKRPRPQRIVDLSPYYNATLTNCAANHAVNHPNHLLEMPQGTNILAGVKFAFTGFMQLRPHQKSLNRGPINMPARFNDISIHAKCRQIHMLHGVVYKPSGIRPVAFLEVHYRSGATNFLPVVYSRQARDWWFRGESEAVEDPDTALAWIGSNPLSRRTNERIRIYRTTFQNPRPNDMIVSVDYVSTLTRGAPFMMALTLQ